MIEVSVFFFTGFLRLGAVGRQQSDLLHDSRTELAVQLVACGAAPVSGTDSWRPGFLPAMPAIIALADTRLHGYEPPFFLNPFEFDIFVTISVCVDQEGTVFKNLVCPERHPGSEHHQH